jgi:formylmethanofuran:tetrahydromethanopterin formyltransferase
LYGGTVEERRMMMIPMMRTQFIITPRVGTNFTERLLNTP